ncbi:hypothetical protein GS416_10510 [Rhodococcus hoagii]|nr:hypothetical protein [Prescottella equi]
MSSSRWVRACTARCPTLRNNTIRRCSWWCHTALAVLLARIGQDRDVVIGTPVAGRGEAELDDVVGMFVNTLALRTEIDPAAVFGAVLAGCAMSTSRPSPMRTCRSSGSSCGPVRNGPRRTRRCSRCCSSFGTSRRPASSCRADGGGRRHRGAGSEVRPAVRDRRAARRAWRSGRSARRGRLRNRHFRRVHGGRPGRHAVPVAHGGRGGPGIAVGDSD